MYVLFFLFQYLERDLRMEGLPFYEFEVNCYIMHISIATQVDSSVIVEEKAIFFYFFTFCKYSTFCVNCLFLLTVASP